MRSDAEIEAEVAALRKLLAMPKRWNEATRSMMAAQILALESRMSSTEAERLYYVDETADEYEDGDNELYHEICRTIGWMNGATGHDAPSKDAP